MNFSFTCTDLLSAQRHLQAGGRKRRFSPFTRKMLLMTKLTFLLLLVTFLQVSATGYSQDKISVEFNHTKISKVLHYLEKKSGYTFYYNNEDLESLPRINLKINNATVPQVLDSLSHDLALNYSIMDNKLVVIRTGNTQIQVQNIHGKVVDEKGNALVGVTVQVKGTSKGTVTDAEGNYTIVAQENAVLMVSYVGFQTQEVSVNGRSNINIQLVSSSTGLNQVVITAFGVKSATRSVPYAVHSVDAKQITFAGTDNIATALAGKIPGAQFTSTAGGPMAGNRINLRGINSLDVDSRPLIVVNGIPIFDNDDNFGGRGFGGNQKGSGINDINPDDIASVTVLSGANAAALYGSQAINGAIIIQTKSGKESKGLGVDYTMNFTLNKLYFTPKFQEEYGGGNSADVFDSYRYGVDGHDSIPYYSPSITEGSFGPKFNGQPVLWWDGKIRPWTAQPNTYKNFFSNGSSMTHTLGLSGGSDKGSFRLSGTYYKYKGFLPNMKENRNSFMFTGHRKISKIISADVFVNYIYNYRQNPPERIDRANFSLNTNDIASVIKDNAINSQGYFLSDSATKYLRGTDQVNNIFYPLVWDPTMDRWQDTRNDLLGSGTVTIRPIEQLSIRLRAGTDRLYDLTLNKQPFQSYAAPTNLSQRQGYYGKSMENDYTNHGDVLVTYTGKLQRNISLNAFAGYSMDDSHYENNNISSANGLLYNNMYSTVNLKPVPINYNGKQIGTRPGYNASASQAGQRLDALFGSVTLGYKNWLYLMATDRNDWSSFLPIQNNHYNYPSIGASFIFSDAFTLPTFVSYGKLRASYGVTGVPGSRYFANATYSQGATYNGAILSSFSNTVPPSNLVAEKNRSVEFGLDGGLWEDRLHLDVTYYINRSDNMINSVPIAPSTGATNMNINSGSLQNKGLEVQVIGDVIRTKNVLWQMTLNGTNIKRKVISLAPGLTQRVLGNSFGAQMLAMPGQEPYEIYMSPLDRDPKTGEVIVDNQGNPTFASTKVAVGDALPKVYGGYVNSFTYKSLTLTALIEYSFGAKVVSYDNEFWTAMGLSKASLFGRDAAHGGVAYYIQNGNYVPVSSGTPPPGTQIYHDGIIYKGVYSNGQPNTSILPAYQYYENRYYNFGTTDAVYKNDYVRLGEISLSYAFPNSITRKLRLQGLSVSLIGRNLWFLYKTVPNESPDETLGTSNTNTGILYTSYPLTRDLGVSLKVNF